MVLVAQFALLRKKQGSRIPGFHNSLAEFALLNRICNTVLEISLVAADKTVPIALIHFAADDRAWRPNCGRLSSLRSRRHITADDHRSTMRAKLRRMTKEHLIDTISAQTRQQKAEVEAVIESLTEKIGEALRMGERVDLRGFGSFVVKQRKARQGRNPRTGETISIAAKRNVTFKPGKELSERIKHSQQGLANI